MHELTLTKDVLKVVLEHAQKQRTSKILKVNIEIGEMRDIVEDLMQKCFHYLAKDTIAKDAILIIDIIPFQIECEKCLCISRMKKEDIWKEVQCPVCYSKEVTPYTGLEFIIKDILIQPIEGEEKAGE